MKAIVLLTALIAGPLSGSDTSSNDPFMQVIAPLPGDLYVSPQLSSENDTSVTFPVADDGTKGLTLTWTGHEAQTQRPVLDLSPELLRRVTASRFGLVGEARTSQAASLDMELGFVPSIDPLPHIDAPHSDLSPRTVWRPFELEFDRRNSGLVLQHIQLWAYLFGTGVVRALPVNSNSSPPLPPDATVLELRHLRLVQYAAAPPLVSIPSPPAPATAGRVVVQIASTPGSTALNLSLDGTSYPDIAALQAALMARHEADPHAYLVMRADKDVPYDDLRGAVDAVKNAGFQKVAMEIVPTPDAAETAASALVIDWRSFLFGALATGLALLALTGLISLSRLWQRRHHERELRRIASLDT